MIEVEQVEKGLEKRILNVVRVNCRLGSGMSDFQSMMYVGQMGGKHYFVRSLEQTASCKEVFNGVRVSADGECVGLNGDGTYTLYDGSVDWPKSELDIDGVNFNRVKVLWDAFWKAELRRGSNG